MQSIKESNELKKEYLKLYKQAVIADKCILEELEELKLSKICPSILIDGMPRGNGGIRDLSGYAVKVTEAEEQLKKARYKRIKIKTDIIENIEKMQNETEKNVLRLKYIHLLTWEEVSVQMNYSLQHVYKIHNTALKNFSCDHAIVCDGESML